MSFDPISEVGYRYGLAFEQLTRADRLFSLKDWAGTVSASQLAVENFAKAVIAAFEVPTWSHDPSNQLNKLIGRLPDKVRDEAKQLSALARELAPEHGRSSYGEPDAGLLPSDIYEEGHASDALENSKKAERIAQRVLSELKVDFNFKER